MQQFYTGSVPESYETGRALTADNMPPIEGTTLVNPMVSDPHGVCAPSYPGDPAFVEQERDMIAGRTAVLSGKYPTGLIKKYSGVDGYDGLVPFALRGLLPDQFPEVAITRVIGDNPNEFANHVLKWVMGRDANYRCKRPTSEYANDFIGNVPDVSENIADASKRAVRKAFTVKYYYWRIRPEQHFRQNLGYDSEAIGHLFPHPHPEHPEYVQGHGTIAGMTMNVIRRSFDLSPEDDMQVYLSAYWVAALRCMLGVHWWDSCQPSLILAGCLPPNRI